MRANSKSRPHHSAGTNRSTTTANNNSHDTNNLSHINPKKGHPFLRQQELHRRRGGSVAASSISNFNSKKKNYSRQQRNTSSSSKNNIKNIELPILESVTDIISDASFFAVRPLLLHQHIHHQKRNNNNNNNRSQTPSHYSSYHFENGDDDEEDEDEGEDYYYHHNREERNRQSCLMCLETSSTQTKLAKKALQLKSPANVSVAGATYSSLFWDPSAHVPLTDSIIEGDAQALLFSFQRSRSLFQKIQQTFSSFMEKMVMVTPAAAEVRQEQEQKRKENKNKRVDPDMVIALLQVFQQCVFELFQIISHARNTICKIPLLLSGTSDNIHMLLEVKDWAFQMKDALFEAVESELEDREREHQEKQQKNEKEEDNQDGAGDNYDDTNSDDEGIDPDLVEASHQCQALLWSDSCWTPPSLKKEIEKAEKWIGSQEIQYLSTSFKELIKKWNHTTSSSNKSISDFYDQQQPACLLKCYGNVIEEFRARHSPPPPTTKNNRNTVASKTEDNHTENDFFFDQDQTEEHDLILSDLQHSLQRIQLFTGEKQDVSTISTAQSNSSELNNDVSYASTIKTQLLNTTSSSTIEQQKIKTAPFFSMTVPDHILSNQKFHNNLSLTDKMQLAITVSTLKSMMIRWRRWLKMKKQKHAKIDGIVRKNLAILCLNRFRQWNALANEARTVRRAGYGHRKIFVNLDNENHHQGFSSSDDDGEDSSASCDDESNLKKQKKKKVKKVPTLTKTTQTLGPIHSAPRFFLKIVQ